MREKVEIVTHREDRLHEGDRRRAPRVEVRLKVEFSETESNHLIEGVVTDISRTGMRIRTVGQVRLCSSDNLRFWVYAGGGMIRVKGHVVRRPSNEEIAIAFDAAGKPAEDKVHEVVEDTAVKNLRFEKVVHRYPEIGQRDKGGLSEAREMGRNLHMTLHDSVAMIKRHQTSAVDRWVDRRGTTHLDGHYQV